MITNSLRCGVVAGPLFVLSFLVQGLTRPDYDPVRHPVSSLALGDQGWIQATTFIVAGALTLALALGLRALLQPGPGATWGPILLGLWAVGLIGGGLFTTDPVSGYPPGTPDLLPAYSGAEAALHDGFSLLGFLGFAGACLVFARRFARTGQPGWAWYSVLTVTVFVIGLGLASAGFSQAEGLAALGGLVQRIMIVAAWAWITALAATMLRTANTDH